MQKLQILIFTFGRLWSKYNNIMMPININLINKTLFKRPSVTVLARPLFSAIHPLIGIRIVASGTGLFNCTLLRTAAQVRFLCAAVFLKGNDHDKQSSLCSNDIGPHRGINSDLSLLPEREEIGLASLPEFSSLNGINNKLTHYAKVVKEKIHKG